MVRMSTSSSSSSKKVSDPSNMDKGRRGWNWTAVVTSDPDGGLTLKKSFKILSCLMLEFKGLRELPLST